VILLVDTSASMMLTNRNNAVLAPILEQLFTFMPVDVQLAVGFFDTRISDLTDFSRDHAHLREVARNRLKDQSTFKGHTAIADAIESAIKKFGAPQSGDSVLIVTDAEDNTSKSLGKKVRHLQRANIRLFMVMLSQRTPPVMADPTWPIDTSGTKDTFAELTETTGGTDWRIDRAANIHRPAILQGIAMLSERTVSRLNTGWELSIRLPQEPREPEKLKLRLTGSDGKLRKYRLEYPQFVFPCEASTTAAATQP
jgi:hypothetical protein